ncbi:hypothetical protein GCM10008967_27770 [Bacillus carboniphilus]|uniref:PLAT domain-containing protein n=1 Tax=Bacillus carboniphilus TaxID=86663 RepID=A0ABN0WFA4_9BACI
MISFLLLAVLTFHTLMMLTFGGVGDGTKHILTTHSPDGEYTIDFFVINPGAMGSFRVEGELNGPLWFKKLIYFERRVVNVDVQWLDNNTVKLNNHKLDLKNDETYLGD